MAVDDTSAAGPIAWIGLGKMGTPMAVRLLEAGYPLTVYNRTVEKTAPLAARGARTAASPAAAARAAGAVFTMVADDTALHAVTLGEHGVLSTAPRGAMLIDMSTVSPRASAEVALEAARRGVAYLRAPVSGSTSFAASGQLTILVSGPREAFDACTPLLARLGPKRYHVGLAEEARILKLVLNLLVGATGVMVAEALTLGRKGGLDWVQMLEILQNSAVASPLIGYKAGALAAREFPAAFSAHQIAKDFGLALGVAREEGVVLPAAAVVGQLYEAMRATGRGGLDFFGVLLLLEDLAGVRR